MRRVWHIEGGDGWSSVLANPDQQALPFDRDQQQRLLSTEGQAVEHFDARAIRCLPGGKWAPQCFDPCCPGGARQRCVDAHGSAGLGQP